MVARRPENQIASLEVFLSAFPEVRVGPYWAITLPSTATKWPHRDRVRLTSTCTSAWKLCNICAGLETGLELGRIAPNKKVAAGPSAWSERRRSATLANRIGDSLRRRETPN